jgi:hypothetical protein
MFFCDILRTTFNIRFDQSVEKLLPFFFVNFTYAKQEETDAKQEETDPWSYVDFGFLCPNEQRLDIIVCKPPVYFYVRPLK